MDLEVFNSDEFKNDFIETVERINKNYNLSIKCGQISCDSQLFTIFLEEEESAL